MARTRNPLLAKQVRYHCANPPFDAEVYANTAVRIEGFEPSRLSALDFKSVASSDSAISTRR